MPSDQKRGGRRTAIRSWRVKDGKHEVYSGTKGDCEHFIRKSNKAARLRLIPPNI